MTLNSSQLILSAATFAAEKHRHQRRKDAAESPYINHPIAVADVLANEGGVDDLVVICAALLHDTVEDTETSHEELEAEFGSEIAGVVAEVSDDKSMEKAERKQFQIEHAPALSHRARLVKLADKICNLRDIAHRPPADWSAERKMQYYDWAKEVVDGMRGASPTLESIFDSLCEQRGDNIAGESRRRGKRAR